MINSPIPTYLQRLISRLRSALSPTVLANRGSDVTAWTIELPTFLDISAEVRHGKLVAWSIDRANRSHFTGEDGPTFPNFERLVALASGGHYDFLGAKARQLTVDYVLNEAEYRRQPSRYVLRRPPWSDGVSRSIAGLSVHDMIRGADSAAVLGPLGSGKSTVARVETVRIAQAALRALGEQTAGMAPRLPLFIELRHVAPEVLRQFQTGMSPAELLTSSLPMDLSESAIPGISSALTEAWYENRLLIALDGIDELALATHSSGVQTDSAAIVALIEHVRSATANSLLITSRTDAAPMHLLDGLLVIELAPLDEDDTTQLTSRVFQSMGLPDAGQLAVSFVKDVRPISSELRTRPLFLVLMAQVYAAGGGRTMSSRVRLLEETVGVLLDRWSTSKRGAASLESFLRCSSDELRDCMERVALASLEEAAAALSGTGAVSRQVLAENLEALRDDADVRKVRRYLASEAGVIVAKTPDTYEFMHRAVQEYLAACHLLSSTGYDRSYSRMLAILTNRPELTTETVLMCAEIMLEQGRINDLWDLASAALDAGGLGTRFDRTDLDYRVWFGSRLIHLIAAAGGVPRKRDAVVLSEFQHAAITAISSKHLGVRRRCEVAETLATVGDPRPGVGVADGLPSFAWVSVPGGPTVIGVLDSSSGLPRERPMLRLEVPTFDIARYPVTRLQYATFLGAADGYPLSTWWQGLRGPLLESRELDRLARQLASDCPTAPVANVTWWEACAFCRWAAARLGDAIRLPTEIEWEKAARGPNHWLYPWGPAFEPAACNWESAGVARPVPVGCFAGWPTPYGDGPEDMLGNIWEWCLTLADDGAHDDHYEYAVYPAVEVAIRDGHRDRRRVVRGACYLNGSNVVRATYRGSDRASARFPRQGFRVVRMTV